VNNFDINDDCFTVNKERAIEICEFIIQSGMKIRFQLYNGIRVDTVTPHLLGKLRQAGCYFICYGCEAGTQHILDKIGKGITLEQVRDAVRWTNEVGISNSVNFIIGHKEETYEDALLTLAFAKSLPTNFVNMYNLLPYPHTDAYEWATHNAKWLVNKDIYLTTVSYRDNIPVYETGEFTAEERKYVVRKGLDLYRKRILIFRMGWVGWVIYMGTKLGWVNRVLTQFALSNKVGRKVYVWLSSNSFKQRIKDDKCNCS